MNKLLPLSEIPGSIARQAERHARAQYATRTDALVAARYEVVDAEGCYSGASPMSSGWLCSRDAADAVAAFVEGLPEGTVIEVRDMLSPPKGWRTFTVHYAWPLRARKQ